jgi:DNA helicase-2/ATP-dependent DNA helicase PcrA
MISPSRTIVPASGSHREARRLFYVGVTRPRKELAIVFQERNYSPWIAELSRRSKGDA